MKNKTRVDNIFLINPFYYLKLLKSSVFAIAFMTILTTSLGAYLAVTFIHPKYKAAAKIIRYDKKISMPRDVPYKFQNFNYDTALQTIRTRKNLTEVIKTLKLDTSVEKIYSAFGVKRSRKSDIIEILYTHKDVDIAVKGANLLSEIFLKNFYEIQNAATKEIYGYYQKQKDDVAKEIDALVLEKEAFLKKHNILSISVQKDYKYEQLNQIDLDLIATKVLKKEFETKVKEINTRLNTMPKEVKLRYSIKSANMKNIQDKVKELRNLRQKYTIHNPKVKRVQSEIKNMRKALENGKKQKAVPDETTYGNNPLYVSLIIEESKSNLEINSSNDKIKELKEQKEEVKSKIELLNRLEKEFQVVQNKIDQKNNLLQMVVERLNEVKIALDSSQEDFKFLEKAKPPRYPEASYKKAIVILFFFFGFGLSLAIVVLRGFFDMRIKEPFDVNKRFEIDLIGSFLKNGKKAHIKRAIIEFENEFLELTKETEKPVVSIFGSDYSQTGKSYVINLLTHLLSSQNRKSLYIESVQEITPEIEDSLINDSIFKNQKIDLSKANKINDNIYKLYFLLDENNEYDLPDFKSLQGLFDSFSKSDFEHVLIEMPKAANNPYLFADIASFCDFVCLVLKAEHSHRKEVQTIMDQLRKQSVSHVKGVLNAIDKKYI